MSQDIEETRENMTDNQAQAAARARLPALGEHDMKMENQPDRYNISTPFPKARTTEEILQIASLIATAGYKILSQEQHEITLRAPVEGEAGDIVGVDNAGKKVFLFANQATKGNYRSTLWFCSPDYPFASSLAEQKARDRAIAGNLRRNDSPTPSRAKSAVDAIPYVEQTSVGRGYIYIAINASMPGLVKIGRTVRTPDTRASEFSAGTGVPTPFTIAYDVPVSDCVVAERQIHQQLAASRVSANREFFSLPVREAIKVVSDVAQRFAVVE